MQEFMFGIEVLIIFRVVVVVVVVVKTNAKTSNKHLLLKNIRIKLVVFGFFKLIAWKTYYSIPRQLKKP